MSYPKLLIHAGKHGSTFILCLNKEEEDKAWLAMFWTLHIWEQFYYPADMQPDELEAYTGAHKHDCAAARCLLEMRSHYEYEGVHLREVETPCSLFAKVNAPPYDDRTKLDWEK